MTFVLKIVVVFLAVICSNAFGSDSDYFNRLLPPGVSMGMSGSQIPVLQNTVRRSIAGDGKRSARDYDLIHRINPSTFSWLYIRDDKLVGQMRITKSNLLSDEERRAERHLSLPVIAEGFSKAADEEVLRVGPNLEPLVVTATMWKSGSSDLTFYTVITDSEITAIAFNSSKISKDIFLSSPLLKQDLEAEAKQIIPKVEGNNPVASPKTVSQAVQSSIPQVDSNRPIMEPSIAPKVGKRSGLSSFSIVTAAIIATAIVVGIVFFLRRK